MAEPIPGAIRALLRPSAAKLEPYDPAFTPSRINLSANENTYGLPPEVHRKLAQALAEVPTNRYPDPLSGDLRAAIASWHGVDPSQVCVGNGGDELLFNLFLAFGGSGHVMVNVPPTFTVYRLYAELLETRVVDVPRDPVTYEVDVDALVDAARGANLVVVTSPNNPTGNLMPVDAVARLCQACPGVVLADEAYMEFAEPADSAEPLLATYDNLVVLHTFSKAYCLAGVRVGYVLSSPGVIGALAAVRQPYSVSVLDQAAGLVLAGEREALAPTIATIKAERARLSRGLAALPGVTAWPSAANFVLVRLSQAHQARETLRDDYSILVRDFSQAPGLTDCLRITVGTPQENDAVVDALGQILEGSRA